MSLEIIQPAFLFLPDASQFWKLLVHAPHQISTFLLPSLSGTALVVNRAVPFYKPYCYAFKHFADGSKLKDRNESTSGTLGREAVHPVYWCQRSRGTASPPTAMVPSDNDPCPIAPKRYRRCLGAINMEETYRLDG